MSPAINVRNVAPTLSNLSITSTIDENDVAVLSGDISDPGTLDAFTLVINWGDGPQETVALAAGTTTFSLTHRYLDDDPSGTPSDLYGISLTVGDDDDGVISAPMQVTVNNVVPVVSISAIVEEFGLEIEVNGRIALLFTDVLLIADFSDVGSLDSHTTQVSWGDGQVDDLGTITGAILAHHAYAEPGAYEIVLRVVDDDTGEAVVTAPIEVIDAMSGLNEVIELLIPFADNWKIARALDSLRGNREGEARNGAIDMLERGNANAALEKIRQAMQAMMHAEVCEPDLDLTRASVLLGLSAKSITVTEILEAESEADTPRELARVAEAWDMVAEGDVLLTGGDFLSAVERYQAAQRKVQGKAHGCYSGHMHRAMRQWKNPRKQAYQCCDHPTAVGHQQRHEHR
jgi:hypothetical protein